MNTNFTNQKLKSLAPGANDSTKFNLAARFENQRVGESANIKITCVTKVPPLTKKRKISWRLLKIENQFLPPIPFPIPPALRGGDGEFFCGALQAGVARLQSPYFFLPLPDGAYAIGEGAGGGQKLPITKVHPSPSSYLAPG